MTAGMRSGKSSSGSRFVMRARIAVIVWNPGGYTRYGRISPSSIIRFVMTACEYKSPPRRYGQSWSATPR